MSRTSRSSVASAGVRSETSRPFRSTTTLSATARTSFSGGRRRSRCRHCARAGGRARARDSDSAGPSAEVGSSRIRTSGLTAERLRDLDHLALGDRERVDAPASRYVEADRVEQLLRDGSRSRGCRRATRAFARSAAEEQILGDAELPDERELLRDHRHAELPARGACRRRRAARPRSRPCRRPAPTEPAITPIIVDLPAPFSPTRPTTSPRRRTSWSTSSTTAGPYSLRTPVRTRSPPVSAMLSTGDGLTGANCLVVGDVGRQVRLGQRADPGADHAVGQERLHDRRTFAGPRTFIAVVM